MSERRLRGIWTSKPTYKGAVSTFPLCRLASHETFVVL